MRRASIVEIFTWKKRVYQNVHNRGIGNKTEVYTLVSRPIRII